MFSLLPLRRMPRGASRDSGTREPAHTASLHLCPLLGSSYLKRSQLGSWRAVAAVVSRSVEHPTAEP